MIPAPKTSRLSAPVALSAETVIASLEALVQCYQRLAKLAQIQHEHVRHSQTEQLLDVLKSRQDVLDQITRHEAAVGPAKRDWANFAGKLLAEKRTQAETLLAETRRLLEEITSADRNDVLVLQQRKLNIGQQINQATAARAVNRRYAASAYRPAGTRMDVQQ